jgi:hypothetical protein
VFCAGREAPRPLEKKLSAMPYISPRIIGVLIFAAAALLALLVWMFVDWLCSKFGSKSR